MKKKIINYGSHYISKLDIKNTIASLKSNYITQGANVEKFEKNLSSYFGSKYAKVLSNGTTALHLAIKSLKLKKSSLVLTTPITFISTASTILMNDLYPDFADINLKSYTLDINKVEDKLKKNKKIKAIIGVDYAGHPCDWKSLSYLKKKYGIYLINDNCHALGSGYLGKKNYASKYADVVTQSFHAVKNFTTGEGGAVLTNDPKINNFINEYRSHGMVKEPVSKNYRMWFYKVAQYGYNYRLSDFQCALGISQLKQLDTFVKKRRLIAENYNLYLSKYSDFLKIPEVNKKDCYHSYHLYPLLINFKKLKIKKNIFFLKMLNKGYRLQVHYIPLYKQPFLKKFSNFYNKEMFSNSEIFYHQEVSLPIFFDYKKLQQSRFIKSMLDSLEL